MFILVAQSLCVCCVVMTSVEEDSPVLFASCLLLLKKRRARKMYFRRINRRRNTHSEFLLINEMRLFDNESHMNYFRMTKSVFDTLLSKIERKLTHAPTHILPISAKQRLAVSLRLLASGNSLQSIAFSFRMGKSTVSNIINETCDAIIESLSTECLPSPTEDKWRIISDGFNSKWNFPHCVGAIDGKHVRMQCPDNSGSECFNYKRYFSFILMAAVDCDYCFTCVDIGAYGRESDSSVFSSSKFGQLILNDKLDLPDPEPLSQSSNEIFPFVFVGDDAFPLKSNLMKPYPGANISIDRCIFNYRLSRARRIVENAFGILANRWRIFHAPICMNLPKAKKMVYTCIILHNFLRRFDHETAPAYRYIPDHSIDFEDNNGEVTPGTWRAEIAEDTGLSNISRVGSNNYRKHAAKIRENFKTYFNTIGAVPWQTKVVTRGAINIDD